MYQNKHAQKILGARKIRDVNHENTKNKKGEHDAR